MTVSQQEKDAMSRLLSILNGDTPSVSSSVQPQHTSNSVELAGPGVPTQADISAMANILNKLNNLPAHVTLHESADKELAEAIQTERVKDGVNVGRYQIMIKENTKRLAGKQYYSIYHSVTNDVIADDISLYETALAVVRALNNGKFTNCKEIRKLFEQDDIYTAHKIDALMYKRKLQKNTDRMKHDIYESRYQASLDRAMTAKRQIKTLSNVR
jgi:hypothetical protein